MVCACSGESGLKVNGEAAHSQDFLSGGRSISRRARIGTAHAQLKAAAHARTRNRGTMRALRINSARVSSGSSLDDYFRHSTHVSPFFSWHLSTKNVAVCSFFCFQVRDAIRRVKVARRVLNFWLRFVNS